MNRSSIYPGQGFLAMLPKKLFLLARVVLTKYNLIVARDALGFRFGFRVETTSQRKSAEDQIKAFFWTRSDGPGRGRVTRFTIMTKH